MRNLIVTSSGFDLATKKVIEQKVQYMGGHYDNALRSIVTHLVAKNNLSNKAIHSYKNNIKIMKISWIEDVWEHNLVNDVNGDDEIFQHHISPLFFNLKITTSGISKKEKDTLKSHIENNGGQFMGALDVNQTNILIVTKPEGEKFRVAKNKNLTCVTPKWVHDCVAASAILPFTPYMMEYSSSPKSSTPNGKNSNANMSANFTANFSIIKKPSFDCSKAMNNLDETLSALNSKTSFQTPKNSKQIENNKTLSRSDKNSKHSHSTTINNILLKNLKDAGQFLDGLNIFIYGFQAEESEKLKKILNKGGATRFNEMSESVTHVIAASENDGNLEKFAKYGAYILSIGWLVECIKLKGKANESKFLLINNSTNSSEPPSPMSKRGAQLLSQNEVIRRDFDSVCDQLEKISHFDELLNRYNSSQPGMPLDKPKETNGDYGGANIVSNNFNNFNNQDESSTRSSELSSDEFFAGLSFFLSGDLSEEEVKYLEDLIVERKGRIVKKRDFGVPDYAVVPVIGALLTGVTAKEVVNVYFIKDCCVEGCVLTPRYYHQPIACVRNVTPLKNCIISVSNYVQGEREFMELMIEALGGIAQSLLARKPKQGALKSTHLVCAEPHGQKYEGALRWGLPVVHHDWLLKCAALGVRVSEKPYLVGNCKFSPEQKNTSVTSQTSKLLSNEVPCPAALSSNKSTESRTVDKLPSQRPEPVTETSSGSHQITPVHGALARVKATETPKSGNSPDPNKTITPTSPYGAFYGKGSPTPGTRKRIWKWMNQGVEFPLDTPTRTVEIEEPSTPMSELISRHLEMLKRKPEDLPPDSPSEIPFKRLNLDLSESDSPNKEVVVHTGLKMMKQIEENYTKHDLKSPISIKKTGESEGHQMVIVSESQAHTEVGWDDPLEKISLGTVVNLDQDNGKDKKPKVFMISCISKQLEEIKSLIEKSGGVVSGYPYFDEKATHLIAGNLTRAEKLMGSIAAGLWVLHPSYIEALKSVKNVYEISEEDYEWGSPKQRFRLNLLSTNAADFAICSYSWRIGLKDGESPPFENQKVVLHVSHSKYDSFKRLIEAGSGIVVKGQPPNYSGVDANLCLYEAHGSTEPINFSYLAKKKIPCVSILYISDTLLRDKNALNKNLIPEYLQHVSSDK